MSNRPPVEMVVTSFDDPIVTALRIEQEAEPAARFGAAGGPPPLDAGIVFLVARQAHEPIGYAGLQRLGDHDAEVRRVYVRPAYRGRGISRLLLAGVEDLARRRGFAVARLEAGDLGDTGLYESSGYVRIPPFGRYPARSVCFEKSLRKAAPR
jgi:GNAT superfamily N-acetyltransferase